MPELPEVETIRQDLRQRLLGREIIAVRVLRPSLVRNTPVSFIRRLKSHHFTDIDRVGKLLIFNLSDKIHHLLVHLKMTGQLIYQWNHKVIAGGHSVSPLDLHIPNPHTRVTISFADGSNLHFNDLRAFGYMKIVNKKELEKIKKNFGIEPLQKNFTLEEFVQRLKGRKISIKALLMNQALIAGIGNIYADESCFAAGIRPARRAAGLTRVEIKRLHQAIERVLKKALKERGTTFNNYLDPDGRKGNFIKYLKVYGRAGEPCQRCRTTLQKLKVAGRGTVFCPRCQK